MKKLSSNELKLIAIICMTIDHIALVFIAENTAIWIFMRTIGRLTAPIMCNFIGEGFHYTSSRKKYLKRMVVFAIISQPFYFFMKFERTPNTIIEFIFNQNVMFTFSIALIMLMIFESKKFNKLIKILYIFPCFMISIIGDWGINILIWALIFYIFRGNFKWKFIVFIIATLIITMYKSTEFNVNFGVLIAIIPLTFYNGKRSNKIAKNSIININKWNFYLYYPLHMMILTTIKYMEVLI